MRSYNAFVFSAHLNNALKEGKTKDSAAQAAVDILGYNVLDDRLNNIIDQLVRVRPDLSWLHEWHTDVVVETMLPNLSLLPELAERRWA